MSFYVRSSLTGTFGGAFQNSDSSRAYPFTYTINSADTWERKTITITGDTSGTWNTTNGTGLQVCWGLGVGSTHSGTAGAWASGDFNSATGGTNLMGTSSATWYLTGVQVEVGETATDFEHRSYGEELALCQRYYEGYGIDYYVGFAGGQPNTGWALRPHIQFNTPKRAAPSLSYSNQSPNWSTTTINSSIGHFTVEVGTGTATTDPRPSFRWVADAEL